MKKISVCGCLILLMFVVIAAGAVSFLTPCVHDDGTAAVCAGAGRMIGATGCLTAALGLLSLLAASHRMKAGIFLSTAATAVLGILIPGTILPLCKMPEMRCRALMRPAMTILFAGILIAALTGWLTERKKES